MYALKTTILWAALSACGAAPPHAPGPNATIAPAASPVRPQDAGNPYQDAEPELDAHEPQGARGEDQDAGSEPWDAEPELDAHEAQDASSEGQDASTAKPCPDSDGDGLCNNIDPCPLDALDDSDGDGYCDNNDACPGYDDRTDSDADGTPDGCDTCPDRSDADEDRNGWPDACDAILWSRTINEPGRLSPSPITWATSTFHVRRRDDSSVSLDVSQELEIGAPNDISTPVPAAMHTILQDPSRMLPWLTHSAGTNYIGVLENFDLLTPTTTFVRIRVHGTLTASGGTVLAWELRGYQAITPP